MRGEVFVATASFMSFVALVLLIFVHVGQINTSAVPRGLALVNVNVSSYGDSLSAAIFNPIYGLYATNASAPLGVSAGLRQNYEFGLYSYCGYILPGEGTCSNHTFGRPFRPYEAFTSDMRANYTVLTDAIITGTDFRNSGYLGQSSSAAFWLIFLGTLGTAVALFSGFAKRNWTFFVSAIFSVLSSIFVLVGAAIWTVLANRTESINHLVVQTPNTSTPVGIHITTGAALYLLWAAFAALFISVIPYLISCCTYRG